MPAQDWLKIVHEELKETLASTGFRKQGNNYSASRNDVVLLVQLQKSTASAADLLRFTVNLGVFCPAVAKKLGFSISKPTIADCHWSERIGYLLPVQKDKWLEVGNEAQARHAGDEIKEALVEYCLPALEAVDSCEKLRSLWASGKSRGLTERQRADYLKAIS